MFKENMRDFAELERSVRWFRGMSPDQFKGCDKLLHALRDDIQQESTYRVRQCLSLLGLHPMIDAKQTKVIIGLSQGNDLAFLWFLWEAHYKKPHGPVEEHNTYTTNEQLILSAIAHLDMASTMRGLDKILPISKHSTKQQEQKLVKEKKPHKRKAQSTENTIISPYMMKQVRPKGFVSSIVSKPKDRNVVFSRYHNYKDQMHEIPNESSRWFSTYEMSPAKREVKKCLSNVLAQLFAEGRSPVGKSLCNVHRFVEHSTDKKQEELTMQTLQRCMEMLDVPGSERKQRSERIVQQLEREVKAAAHKLQLYRNSQLTALRKIKRNEGGSQSCAICSQLVATPGFEPRHKADFSLLLPEEDSNIPAHPITYQEEMEDELGIRVLQWGTEKQYKRIHLDDDEKYKIHFDITSNGKKVNCPTNAVKKPSQPKSQCMENDCKMMILNEKNKIEHTIESGKEAEEFQYCSSKNMTHGLLRWDFFKIYETHFNEPSADRQPLIKSYCIRALNKAMEELEKNDLSPIECQQTASDAADKCARKTIEETNKMLEQSTKLRDPAKLDSVEATNIDPDNMPMLIELLKTGVDKLKENPYYVLVTLPNAHKLPVLIDWIAERYGKTYSYRQMNQIANSSHIVYEQIMKKSEQNGLPLPNSLDDFNGSKEYFKCRLNQTREDYYSRLNDMALKQSRLIWLALRGYSGLTGCNPETFFAYMPAKDQDLMRQNVWKSTDYRQLDTIRKQLERKKCMEN